MKEPPIQWDEAWNARALRLWRVARGTTALETAKELELSPRTYHRGEAGESPQAWRLVRRGLSQEQLRGLAIMCSTEWT